MIFVEKEPANASIGMMMLSDSSLTLVNCWVHTRCGVLDPPRIMLLQVKETCYLFPI